ncbi:hypothetical protein BDZ89DRAFT_271202 [Hymenopellis radicata]|nr:hypothetical protein BDZ89DRAFT_271202 [Hymenopellis radicata]
MLLVVTSLSRISSLTFHDVTSSTGCLYKARTAEGRSLSLFKTQNTSNQNSSNSNTLFGNTGTTRRSHHATHHTAHNSTAPRTHRRHFWQRKDRDRVAGGYSCFVQPPHNTGRKHAKHELHKMGRSSHVPFMTKVKRTLGIRSTPQRERRVHY